VDDVNGAHESKDTHHIKKRRCDNSQYNKKSFFKKDTEIKIFHDNTIIAEQYISFELIGILSGYQCQKEGVFH
jgi:hypothetical protein